MIKHELEFSEIIADDMLSYDNEGLESLCIETIGASFLEFLIKYVIGKPRPRGRIKITFELLK